MFTYMPGHSEMSGHMDTTRERDVIPSVDNIVTQYFRPDCPAFFRRAVPAWVGYLPRFLGEPVLRVLCRIILALRGAPRQMPCQLRVLADVIREDQIERIDVLKVDVEGAELAVLRSLSDSDWAKVACVLVEVHESLGNTGPVADLLRKHGLTDHVSVQDPVNAMCGLSMIRATRP